MFSGGWQEVLIEAGLVEAPPGWKPGRADNGKRANQRRSGYDYTLAEVRGALREIAGRLGRSPLTTEYPAERDRLLRRGGREGLAAPAGPVARADPEPLRDVGMTR